MADRAPRTSAKERALPPLSANGRRLIEQLSRVPGSWVTAAALAQAVGISRRTVLRELSGAEDWLLAAGYHFEKRPGQGLMLHETAIRCQALRAALQREGNDNMLLPRQVRRGQLLALLLSADGPAKTYVLAKALDISEHALASDLDAAKEWLHPHGITLCRRPGVGVWLEGTPEQLRRAEGSLLRLWLPDQDKAPGGPADTLLDPEVMQPVRELLQAFETEAGLHFTDSGFLALTVHTALTIQQLRRGVRDQMAPVCPGDPALAKKLARRLEQTFGLRFSKAEVGCLALYLDAYGSPQASEPDVRELHIRYLAAQLIREMERLLHADFSHSPNLADDLCCHLRPLLHRLEQGTCAENPQLELIQEQYAQLWQATRTACDMASQTLSLPPIPDAEAGFLAMHFGAVLEQQAASRRRVSAVVVCPYGMSSSRFLSSQLAKEFPQLDICSIASARHLDTEKLRADGIDLVISTVPLQLDYPKVSVSAILQDQDRTVLQAAIQRAQASARTQDPPTKPSPPQADRAQALRYAARLSGCILELVDTLSIRPVQAPCNRAQLIQEGARLFCPGEVQARALEGALLRRERLGDTYIAPLQAVLLHCRTDTVPNCRLGYLQAQPPVYEPGHIIRGALVLLAPLRDGEVPAEVMQAVSSLLIDQPALMEALRQGTAETAAAILERGLGDHFRKALTFRLGGRA